MPIDSVVSYWWTCPDRALCKKRKPVWKSAETYEDAVQSLLRHMQGDPDVHPHLKCKHFMRALEVPDHPDNNAFIWAVEHYDLSPPDKKRQREEHTMDDECNQPMEKRIYIGNLSWDTTVKSVLQLVEEYGDGPLRITIHARRPMKVWAFVDFCSSKEAAKAVDELNGTYWDDRRIIVDLALW